MCSSNITHWHYFDKGEDKKESDRDDDKDISMWTDLSQGEFEKFQI